MRLAALLLRLGASIGAAVFLLASPGAAADDLQDITKLISAGQQVQALDRVNAYLTTHPKDAQARFLKGIVLTEQGKQAEAIQIFSGLTEEFPELPEPYNNLAVIYAAQGQYEKARNALELAIHTHPSYGTAHENLGDVYAKLATKSYDKALQLDRNNTSAQGKLSLIRGLFEKPASGALGNPAPIARSEAHAGELNRTADSTTRPGVRSEPAKAVPVRDSDSNKSPAGRDPEPVRVAQASDKDNAKAPTPKDAEAEAVSETVRSWAAAWAAKNTDGYLAFYAPDFKTPNGENRASWEKQRRERLAKPGPIEIHLSELNVTLSEKDAAQVSFRQKYSSSNLRSTNLKILYLHRSGDKWVIVEERVRG
jgi:hypothetical protein